MRLSSDGLLAEETIMVLAMFDTAEALSVTKRDLQQSANLLRAEMNALHAEMNGHFGRLFWMLGVIHGLLVAILVRLFFVPGP